MTIEESKDLTSLSLDELIGNLKRLQEVLQKKRKVRKTSRNDKKTFQRSRDDKNGKSDRKCFICRDPNHLIRECPKPPKDKNQRAFVGGSWSDSDKEDNEKAKNKTCLMTQASSEICLGIDLEPNKLIKDSGCSKHMTGNQKIFSTYKAYNGGNVVFGSNLRGNIIVKCTISNDSLNIDNVEHVDNLRFNLLSVSQICDNKCKLIFFEHDSEITKDEKVIGKQAHAIHKAKNIVSTTRCLELLYMDLFGPSAVWSCGRNLYTLVIVDDYSRYTWTRFLKDKSEAFEQFKIFSRKIQNQLGCSIVSIRTDRGREFDNEVQLREFCNANDITHNFSAPRSPQSNGVVERKNMTLQEMNITMLNEQSLLQKFWCNTVDTSTYILNRILIRAILGKTPYELLRDKDEAIKVAKKKVLDNDIGDETLKFDEVVNIQESKNHQLGNAIGNLNQRSLRNKLDENGVVSRNKARLVAQGYNQNQGIDYDETYASVTRLESIRILLANAYALDFKLFQMDAKSAFLNGFINKEDLEGQMFVEFVIQNQLLSFTLEEFSQILGIPFRGQCFFSDKWSLDHLESSIPTGGPYQKNHPSLDENNLYVQEEREDVVTRIRHDKVIDVEENQILTCEITSIMKT
ncbi:retrovirus-related pol polyprotein from transposon TNT 1-94 [Tanacetum coccineum]